MKKKTIILFSITLLIALAVVALGAKQYYHFEVSNFTSIDGEEHIYYIDNNITSDSILSAITQDYQIESHLAWELTCKHMKFTQPKPGYYKFPAQISNRTVVRRLQLGEQTPYKLAFTQNIRTRDQLAGHLGNKLRLDSAEIKLRLDSKEYLAKLDSRQKLLSVSLYLTHTKCIGQSRPISYLTACTRNTNVFGTKNVWPKQTN